MHTEMLYRVHYATDGVVGNLMNLLRCATSLAEERGSEVIDLAILSLAFQEELVEHLAHKVDPFSQPTDSGFAPVTPPQETPARGAKSNTFQIRL